MSTNVIQLHTRVRLNKHGLHASSGMPDRAGLTNAGTVVEIVSRRAAAVLFEGRPMPVLVALVYLEVTP